MLETYQIFQTLLNERTTISELPEVFAAATECRNINVIKDETQLVQVEEIYKVMFGCQVKGLCVCVCCAAL